MFAKFVIASKEAAAAANHLVVQHFLGTQVLTKDQRTAAARVQSSYQYNKPIELADIAPLMGVGAFKQDQWGK